MKPSKTGQVLHHIVDRSPVREALFDRSLQAREGYLSQFARLRHVTVEAQECLLDPLSRKLSGWVLDSNVFQNSVRIDDDSRRTLAADRVADTTTTAAATTIELGPSR